MLKKLLSLLVIIAIIIAISAIFIHLYSSGRNERQQLDALKKSVKENSNNKTDSTKKKKSTNKKSKKDSETNNKDKNSTIVDLDDKDVDVNDNNTDNTNSSDNSVVTGSEVAVASTGSNDKVIISIVGGIVVITGVSVLGAVNIKGI